MALGLVSGGGGGGGNVLVTYCANVVILPAQKPMSAIIAINKIAFLVLNFLFFIYLCTQPCATVPSLVMETHDTASPHC